MIIPISIWHIRCFTSLISFVYTPMFPGLVGLENSASNRILLKLLASAEGQFLSQMYLRKHAWCGFLLSAAYTFIFFSVMAVDYFFLPMVS